MPEQVGKILDEHTILTRSSVPHQTVGRWALIKSFGERGLRIPRKNISVISFGGYDVSELLTPQLSYGAL